MKIALLFLFAGLAVLGYLATIMTYQWSGNTIDVFVYDTYFVIDTNLVAGTLAFLLLTLFSLGGLIGTRFRSRVFLTLFLICLIVAAVGAYWLAHLFRS